MAVIFSGGMDTEDAFSLSDAFVQKCELLQSLDRITNLQYHMVLDFTERVERIRLGKRPTKLAMDVANYVQHHLSEPITAEAIASKLYISRPYLSLKFKEETGETSSTAIGSYLGFSSQSHFSRVFKKYAGQTPGEYREKNALYPFS